MSAILLTLLGKFWPYLALIAAGLGWGIKQRMAGAASERAKQAAAEAKARDVADEVQNDLGTLIPDQRREELRKWSKS